MKRIYDKSEKYPVNCAVNTSAHMYVCLYARERAHKCMRTVLIEVYFIVLYEKAFVSTFPQVTESQD